MDPLSFALGAVSALVTAIPAAISLLMVLRWSLAQSAAVSADRDEWSSAAASASVAAAVARQAQQKPRPGVHSMWLGENEDADDDETECVK